MLGDICEAIHSHLGTKIWLPNVETEGLETAGPPRLHERCGCLNSGHGRALWTYTIHTGTAGRAAVSSRANLDSIDPVLSHRYVDLQHSWSTFNYDAMLSLVRRVAATMVAVADLRYDESHQEEIGGVMRHVADHAIDVDAVSPSHSLVSGATSAMDEYYDYSLNGGLNMNRLYSVWYRNALVLTTRPIGNVESVGVLPDVVSQPYYNSSSTIDGSVLHGAPMNVWYSHWWPVSVTVIMEPDCLPPVRIFDSQRLQRDHREYVQAAAAAASEGYTLDFTNIAHDIRSCDMCAPRNRTVLFDATSEIDDLMLGFEEELLADIRLEVE